MTKAYYDLTTKKFTLKIIQSNYALIQNRNLTKPHQNWRPIFSPQITIQHPLEYTIPLAFMLFGFDNPQYIFPFCASLPGRDVLLGAYKETNSKALWQVIEAYTSKKICGLLFLHALTLNQMISTTAKTDTELLEETLEGIEKNNQIDPKMRLALMSRRPFSSMLQDINENGDANYGAAFNNFLLKHNTVFKQDFLHFTTINYAEHFFSKTGEILSLISFWDKFKPEFLLEVQLNFEGLANEVRLEWRKTQIGNCQELIDTKKKQIQDLIAQFFNSKSENVKLLEIIIPYFKPTFLEKHRKTLEQLKVNEDRGLFSDN